MSACTRTIMITLMSLQIPLLVYQLDNDDHPVEVGLADAFYYDVFQSFC